jgi:hypothetical protein
MFTILYQSADQLRAELTGIGVQLNPSKE